MVAKPWCAQVNQPRNRLDVLRRHMLLRNRTREAMLTRPMLSPLLLVLSLLSLVYFARAYVRAVRWNPR
jgi:hypothetical protein